MKMFDSLTGRSRDFKRVFLGTEEGKRVLAHLYKMCGMNQQIHVPSDPNTTSFNAGKHRIGQGIQSILGQDEQTISEILKIQGVKGGDSPTYDPYNNT